MKIHELFSGDTQYRGLFTGINPSGKKLAIQQPVPFDWEAHLKGNLIQGLSPINTALNKARWLCVDIDIKIKPEEFCAKIFNKLGPQYFPFKTMSGRWRVVEFLEDWENLDHVKERSKELEKLVAKKTGYKADSGHTLPYNEGWVFLPYHYEKPYKIDACCYSPGGNPLTQEQFEFRARYKNNSLVAAAVGMKEGTGGRPKALYAIALYKKHYPECDINLEELNKNFSDVMDERYFNHEYQHVLKSITKDNYDKEYLLNAIPKWCSDFCGVRPPYYDEIFIEEVVTPELVKNFVYCNQNADFYDIRDDVFRDKEQLNDWWSHVTKGKSITKQLLLDPGLIKVWSVLIHPGYPPGVIRVNPNEIKGIKPGEYLNYYKPSSVQATPGDHERFIEYYKWLFESDDKIIYDGKEYTQFDVVMMFLANLVQNPGSKAMWGILIQSVPGSGKGLLAEIMEGILGHGNCLTNVTFDNLTDKHSMLLFGKQLMVINELSLTGRRIEGKELSNKLKPYFTDPVIILNPKFKEEILCPNFVNILLYSNEDKPLHLDKDDRRVCVIRVNRSKEEILEKIETFISYLLELKKNPSAIKHYLQNIVKLPNERFFGGHAPLTEAKEDLIGYSKDDLESILDEAFENKSYPFNYKSYADNTVYTWRGYIVIENFYEALKYDPLFKGVYLDRSKIQLWVKKKCIPWKTGELNKQIFCGNREKRRAWLIEDIKDYHFTPLSEWSPTAIGDDFEKFKFIPKTTSIHFQNKSSTPDEKGRTTNCWSCKSEITFEQKTQCRKCSTGILCRCGACICDKPIQGDIF